MNTGVSCVLFVCASAVLAAQGVGGTTTATDPDLSGVHGTQPKNAPSDYPNHMPVFDGKASLGSEFMGHTISGRNVSFFADHFIVVEVAVYPAKGETVSVSDGDFQIRLNEKKILLPQPPQSVAAAFKYADWNQNHQLEVSAGVGDGSITVGRPFPTERFPGDGSQQGRLPAPPAPPPTSNAPKSNPQTADQATLYSALPEGPTRGPISGYLYFAYDGKLKHLHSIELLVRNKSDKPDVLQIR